jgi:hypothetical protein
MPTQSETEIAPILKAPRDLYALVIPIIRW